jgi:hypothetical protein
MAISSINKELNKSESTEQDAKIITKSCSRYGLNEKNIRTIGKFFSRN